MMDTPQPLDRILTGLGLTNAALAKASREQLTCKQVQKARKGKTITSNIQGKVLRALNACALDKKYSLNDIFAETSPTEADSHDGDQA
jgi:hypothetical protein